MKLNKKEYDCLIKIIDYNYSGYMLEWDYDTLIKIVEDGLDVELNDFKDCDSEGKKNHIYNDYLTLSLAIKEIEMKSN